MATNLPAQWTSFVGREALLTDLKSLLNGQRFVTLTGMAGIGKTRLALESAAAVAPSFPDGTVLVELADRERAGLATQAVAQALGIETPDGDLRSALTAALDERKVLLILDSCEHLLDECVHLVRLLLAYCPSLHVLATSREPLGIPGESVFPVPALTLPDPTSALDDTQMVAGYEAIRLFVERSVAVAPDFRLHSGNTGDVVRIVTGLDGLPLAIELAASWARSLSPAQIAARLDDRFSLLSTGNRGAPPRHRTLAAAIDWSYNLLAEPERALFRRLSVFANGWTVESAETACAGAPVMMTEVLGLLAALVNKSLVVVEQSEGRTRYRMCETLREYAAAKMTSPDEIALIQEQLAEYYCAFVTEAEQRLRTWSRRVWAASIEAEYDNLRTVLDFGIQSEPERTLCLVESLWFFWQLNGYLTEARLWSGRMLRHSQEWGDSMSHGRALRVAGEAAAAQQDSGARRYFDEAARIASANADQSQLARARFGQGVATAMTGDLEASREFFEGALALFRMLDDRWWVARCLGQLGGVVGRLGDKRTAQRLLEDSIAEFEGVEGVPAHPYVQLGRLAARGGDHQAAAGYFEEAIIHCRESVNNVVLLQALLGMANVAIEGRDWQTAAAAVGEALVHSEQQDNRVAIARALSAAGGVAAGRGDYRGAARLLAAGEAHRPGRPMAEDPVDQAQHKRWINTARTGAGSDFSEAWAEGEALSLQPAIAQARVFVAGVEQAIRDAEDERASAAAHEPDTVREKGATSQAPAEIRPPSSERDHTGQSSPSGALRILALGPVIVQRDDHVLTAGEWKYAKARELLFFILLHGPQTREQIGLALWPEASSRQLRSSLGVTLYHLRRALGGAEWIAFDGKRYSFACSLPFRFDVDDFESSITEARTVQASDPVGIRERLGEAVALYRGPLLEDLPEVEWTQGRRAQLEQAYLGALLTLADSFYAAGQYGEAATHYSRAIAGDEYLEEAHRGLMRCYSRQGERGRALRHYRALERLFREELGAPPALETRELGERLQRGMDV